MGFAIPSNRVKFIVPQLIQHGHVIHSGRAGLGVQTDSVDPSIAVQANLAVNHGVLIVAVIPGGPAATTGLKPNDVIVQAENTSVTNESTLIDALLSHEPGQTVALKIVRGSQQMSVNVTLGELRF